MQHVTTLLFDLGGVLIELGDMTEMMATSPQSPDDIWRNWIRSPSVRRFESGQCDEAEFASNMIDEFQLSANPSEFLENFRRWPKGTFADAEDLLIGLTGQYRLACLSNTNITHYEDFLRHQPIFDHFDATFFSHQTGFMKPADEAYRHALQQLGQTPEQVLFFDDNEANVKAAIALGMQAEQVNAPSDIMDRLNGAGLIEDRD